MSSAVSLTKRQLIFVGVAFTILLATLLWSYPTRERSLQLDAEYGRPTRLQEEFCSTGGAASNLGLVSVNSKPIRRRNVAIASSFGFHHDVYLALAWTMERVMGPYGGTLQVYATTPFTFAFQDIVDQLGLYHGSVKPKDDLIPDVENQSESGGIDMIVLGTCEVDLRGDWHQQLLAAWDARDDDHKFQLVCIVHHVLDKGWQPRIADWARRGALRLLPISSHVGKGFRKSFDEIADSIDPLFRHAGYEYIPIDVHVPILDIANLPETVADKVLSKAVIQGSFNLDRRDYIHLFRDLRQSLAEDSLGWGYLPLQGRASYVVNPEDPSPFHLYLIGSGTIEVPHELENIVSVHVGLDYSQFYDLMSGMDVCIPAFAENGYFEHQASSTFAMALECNVPILVTKRMRRSYTYADDDRVVITRPTALREIEVIKALRTRNATSLADSSKSLAYVREDLKDMMRKGWIRPKADFLKFKQEVWRQNELVVQRLLRDL